jgi:hypothetical protein
MSVFRAKKNPGIVMLAMPRLIISEKKRTVTFVPWSVLHYV